MTRKKGGIGACVLMCVCLLGGCGDNSSGDEVDISVLAEKSYSDGYMHGYADGLSGVQKSSSVSEKTDRIQVMVSGDFTAAVRQLIPDYVTDGTTNRCAVVTLFQDGPFVLKLNEKLCSDLIEGETYTFIVKETETELPSEMLWDDGNVSSDAAVLNYLTVSDVRVPEEDEYGLDCWRVNYSAVQ